MFKSVVFLVLVFNKRDYAAADRFWSLQGPGAMWSVGASAMVTLFDGGRRRVFNDEAKASYESTVASYRETVLTGFQQVEDNLAALRILEQRQEFMRRRYRTHSGRSISQTIDTRAA